MRGYAAFIKKRSSPHRIHMRRSPRFIVKHWSYLDGQQYLLAGSGGDAASAGHLLAVQSASATPIKNAALRVSLGDRAPDTGAHAACTVSIMSRLRVTCGQA